MTRTRSLIAAFSIATLLVLGGVGAESASAKVPHFANCTAMHHTYKHGVGKAGARDHVRGKTKPVTNFVRNTAIYNANKKMDADKDGVACEAR
jgi:hypothetical protein